MGESDRGLNKEEKEFLLRLARDTIKDAKQKNITPISDNVTEKRGVFVTLTIDGELRGCIGHIMPIMPMYESIIECAHSAAYQDPRFSPVSEEEKDKLHIEISILTVPKKLEYKDGEDLLKKLTNKDGIVLKKGYNTATFLPQVWEQLPEKEEFLSHLCMKAGLRSNEWEEGDIDIEIYHVEKFEEEND